MSEDKQLLGVGSRVKHPAYGDGVVIGLRVKAYDICFHLYGIKSIGKEYEKFEIVEAIPAENEVTYTEAEKSLMKILRNWSDITEEVDLDDKWVDGMLKLIPGREGMKDKEIPIETFFHKIVMVRDRLRVMEQKINSSDKLSDEEKVNLQQYITRIYGSLTTFNVLFKYKEDHIVGSRS